MKFAGGAAYQQTVLNLWMFTCEDLAPGCEERGVTSERQLQALGFREHELRIPSKGLP